MILFIYQSVVIKETIQPPRPLVIELCPPPGRRCWGNYMCYYWIRTIEIEWEQSNSESNGDYRT